MQHWYRLLQEVGDHMLPEGSNFLILGGHLIL